MSENTCECNSADYLEDVIESLQKTFSRVMGRAAQKRTASPSEPCAVLTGNVEYKLAVRVNPERDRLVVNEDGVISLDLTGSIDLDVRYE